jgi:hypothetical protein
MMTLGHHDDQNAAFFSQAINRAAQSSDPSLKNLEEISYGHAYPEANIRLEEILPFFYLPSLRKVDAVNLSAEDFAWERPLTSTNIEELSFSSSGIADEAWPNLLRPMRQLKHLDYSPGNPKPVGFMSNTPEGLGASLAFVRDTLESLSVNEYFLEYEDSVLGSLREFPKLKEIDVQMGLLIGTEALKTEKELWEMLPSVLEEITFQGGEDLFEGYGEKSRQDTIEQVVDVVLRNESHFPALKNIYMRSFDGLDLKTLREICIARGVGLNDW